MRIDANPIREFWDISYPVDQAEAIVGIAQRSIAETNDPQRANALKSAAERLNGVRARLGQFATEIAEISELPGDPIIGEISFNELLDVRIRQGSMGGWAAARALEDAAIETYPDKSD